MIRLNASKAIMGPYLRHAFEKPVDKVPDYPAWVAPDKQMWLQRIKTRVGGWGVAVDEDVRPANSFFWIEWFMDRMLAAVWPCMSYLP
jgi:hypothetical protein